VSRRPAEGRTVGAIVDFVAAQINDDRQIELFHLSSMRRRDSRNASLATVATPGDRGTY